MSRLTHVTRVRIEKYAEKCDRRTPSWAYPSPGSVY
jgi:hypothetical protein